MSEPPEYREIECIGGPSDGFAQILRLQDVAAARIYEPIEPRFCPEDWSHSRRLDERASLPKHPGVYTLEDDDGRPVHRWYQAGDDNELPGGVRAQMSDR
jgi:hypothetical protein